MVFQKTTEMWLRDFRETHKDLYEYLDQDIKYNVKTQIKCSIKDHGIFYKIPANHKNGQGCPKCIKEKNQLKADLFFDTVYDIYKASNTLYIYPSNIPKSKEYLDIICIIHGKFKCTPNNHMRGYGCPKCGREKVIKKITMSQQQWIFKREEIHGKFYSYPEPYINYITPITITCPFHR